MAELQCLKCDWKRTFPDETPPEVLEAASEKHVCLEAQRALALRTVAATLRTVAWAEREDKPFRMYDTADELDRLADLNENLDCCPVCEEVTCDEGCPLEAVRKLEEEVEMRG